MCIAHKIPIGLACITIILLVTACQSSEEPVTPEVSERTITSPSAPACTPAPAGLIAWWPGDGHADDIVSTNHGTLENGAGYATGMVGLAFSFDGFDDQVRIPHSMELSFSSYQPVTIEFWTYRTSPASPIHLLGKRIGCGSNASINYQIVLNPAPYNLNWGAIYGPPLPLNTWTHYAGTFDGSTYRVYINGTFISASPSNLSRPPENLADLLLGGSGTCAHFGGLMDEVKFYNRALTAAEIAGIFQAGASGNCKTSTITVEIDIHPGSATNPVNPFNQGDIPVAILTTKVADGDAFDFDATTVDPSTVEFGPYGASIAHTGGHIEDVDLDGDMDLILHFYTQATGIACGHTSATLRGLTYGSDEIEGQDVLVTVGCP